MRLRIPVLLGQTEVDDIDLVRPLPETHEEVVWLDVPVDEALRVHVLDAADLLEGRPKARQAVSGRV